MPELEAFRIASSAAAWIKVSSRGSMGWWHALKCSIGVSMVAAEAPIES